MGKIINALHLKTQVNLMKTDEVGTTVSSILQMRKLRCGKVCNLPKITAEGSIAN